MKTVKLVICGIAFSFILVTMTFVIRIYQLENDVEKLRHTVGALSEDIKIVIDRQDQLFQRMK